MKKQDLQELELLQLQNYQNQLKNMILQQKKILISLNQDLYEINQRNIFLKEHTEELIKITNTCLTSKQNSTQKFITERDEQLKKIGRALSYLTVNASGGNSLINQLIWCSPIKKEKDLEITLQKPQQGVLKNITDITIQQWQPNEGYKEQDKVDQVVNQSEKEKSPQQLQEELQQKQEIQDLNDEKRIQRFECIKDSMYSQDEI